MKRKNGRGRPIKSDKIRVKAVPHDKVDIEKMAQALVRIAKDMAEKNHISSRPEGE